MTGLVRVWLVPVRLPPAAAAHCARVLDDGEQARAQACHSPDDRQRFTAAHGALRILAAAELGCRAAALHWSPGPQGKPQLDPPWSWLHTSLSHSAGMAAVALSAGRPVGVDIQQVLPGPDPVALSARFFAPREARHIAAGPDPGARADRFTRLWVRKEAAVKAAGGRLWASLALVAGDAGVIGAAGSDLGQCCRVADLTGPVGYRAAVALAGDAPFTVQAGRWPDPPAS